MSEAWWNLRFRLSVGIHIHHLFDCFRHCCVVTAASYSLYVHTKRNNEVNEYWSDKNDAKLACPN